MIDVRIPMRLISVANARLHKGAIMRMKKGQRDPAMMHVAGAYSRKTAAFTMYPFTVVLTRYGKRELDDDNLASAFKYVRDGVAKALGVDDGDKSRVLWEYAQVAGSKDYSVRIEIYPFGAVRDSTGFSITPCATPQITATNPGAAPNGQDCVPVAKETRRADTPRRKPRSVSFWGDKA